MARILLVDDDPDFLMTRALMLAAESHQVKTAACGKEAMEILAAQGIDLVLLDLDMPEQSGLELIDMIRSRTASPVRIIILSGRRDSAAVVRALDKGADDYIEKLASPEVFLARVRRRLAS